MSRYGYSHAIGGNFVFVPPQSASSNTEIGELAIQLETVTSGGRLEKIASLSLSQDKQVIKGVRFGPFFSPDARNRR
jgi:hypothetical protein